MSTLQPLSENERSVVSHIAMWGSDGYPVHKLGKGWVWGPFFGINGPPVIFKTKREAVASFEAFHDLLLLRIGEEAAAHASR